MCFSGLSLVKAHTSLSRAPIWIEWGSVSCNNSGSIYTAEPSADSGRKRTQDGFIKDPGAASESLREWFCQPSVPKWRKRYGKWGPFLHCPRKRLLRLRGNSLRSQPRQPRRPCRPRQPHPGRLWLDQSKFLDARPHLQWVLDLSILFSCSAILPNFGE